MRPVTTGWLAAAQAAVVEPIWLVDLSGVGRRFYSRRVSTPGAWVIGDGTRIGSGQVIGGPALPPEYDLQVGGVPAVGQALRDTSGRVEVSGARLVLLNHAGLAQTVDPVSLDNSRVDIRLGFVGLPLAQYLTIWAGVVDRTETSRTQWHLDCIDQSLQVHRDLSVKIGAEFFPGASEQSRNRAIPILLGLGTNLPAILIESPAVGTLAFALLGSGLGTIYINEFDARFPASGSLIVDGETGIGYYAQAKVNIQGRTYLAFFVNIRTSPAAHAAGVQVQGGASASYLLAYALATVGTIRENGVIVPPANYIVSRQASGADRPVTTVSFPAAPTGAITFDGTSANLDTADRLTNGGFETGDLAGWTVEAGVTASVGASSPTPATGGFRASVQGGQNNRLGIYQDVPTVIGETYQLTAAYRTAAASSLVANGDFETGDLTSWVLSLESQASVGVRRQAFTPDIVTFLPVGGLADGDYSFVAQAGTGFGNSGFQANIYQDIAVTPSTSYTLSFTYASFQYFFTGNIATQNSNGGTSVQVSIGSTTVPTKYAARVGFGVTNVYTDGQRVGGFAGGTNVAQVTFTPTEATIRVTLIALGQNPGSAPVVIDGVKLQQAGVPDATTAAVSVLAQPGGATYLTQAVTHREQWQQVTGQLLAQTAVTRVRLASSYALTPQPAYFDGVSLQPVLSPTGVNGGENPVDALIYLIRTFLPGLSINAAAFATAHNARQDWRIRAYLATPGDSRALLISLAEQAELIYFEDALGQATLALQDVSGTPAMGFGRSTMVEESFEAVAEPLDNLATHIYVWYGLKAGVSQSTTPGDFAGSVYATPTGTSDTSQPQLAVACAQAKRFLRRERRIDIYATAIADVATATLKLRAVVARVTVRSTDYTWRTWIDAARLEVGDLVQLSDPRQTDAVAIEAQVLAVSVDPQTAQVSVTARGLRPAEQRLEFEIGPVFVELDGQTLDFDFTTAFTAFEAQALEFQPDELTARRRARAVPEEDDE